MEMAGVLSFYLKKVVEYMKTVLSMLLVFCMCFAVSGCATKPSPEQITNAYYGPYPENYQQILKNYLEFVLFDPDSAKYYFQAEPVKHWYPILLSREFEYGWYGIVGINAKNNLGGYAGARPFWYLIRDDKVIMMGERHSY